MRNTLAIAIILCASVAFAGPLDVFTGIPDAPGVVPGGSFGATGNDYYGDMRWGSSRSEIKLNGSAKIAKPRVTVSRTSHSRSEIKELRSGEPGEVLAR